MVSSLNQSQTVGEATRLLQDAGFQQAEPVDLEPTGELRVFEDARSVVGVVFFRSWTELASDWPSAQAALVDRISSQFRRSDAKSWDGYLVLLTSDEEPTAEAVAEVRRDTSRLRKLVGTGSDLTSIESIAGVLLPVLPLELEGAESMQSSLLERIPAMVEAYGVEPELAAAAIASFEVNRSPMEGITAWRAES